MMCGWSTAAAASASPCRSSPSLRITSSLRRSGSVAMASMAARIGDVVAACAGTSAIIASALAFGAPGSLWGALATVVVAVPFAALGGKLGLARRPFGG